MLAVVCVGRGGAGGGGGFTVVSARSRCGEKDEGGEEEEDAAAGERIGEWVGRAPEKEELHEGTLDDENLVVAFLECAAVAVVAPGTPRIPSSSAFPSQTTFTFPPPTDPELNNAGDDDVAGE
jgi:hypothetical protein